MVCPAWKNHHCLCIHSIVTDNPSHTSCITLITPFPSETMSEFCGCALCREEDRTARLHHNLLPFDGDDPTVHRLLFGAVVRLYHEDAVLQFVSSTTRGHIRTTAFCGTGGIISHFPHKRCKFHMHTVFSWVQDIGRPRKSVSFFFGGDPYGISVLFAGGNKRKRSCGGDIDRHSYTQACPPQKKTGVLCPRFTVLPKTVRDPSTAGHGPKIGHP